MKKRRSGFRRGRAVSVFLLLSAAAWPAAAQERESLTVWDYTIEGQAGAGYRNNVLRSSLNQENSTFFITALDASLMGLSESDAYLILYLLGEDIRYTDAPSVEYEQFISTMLQGGIPVGRHEAGLRAGYLYQHQVVDVSETEAVARRVLILGHGADVAPYWEHVLTDAWSLRLEAGALRQLFEQELDDYWEVGGRLELLHRDARRSEWLLAADWTDRLYDTRVQYDAAGQPEAGTELVYHRREAEGRWRQYWDADRHWRTTTRIGALFSRDNGSGYFDYDRYQVGEQLRWENDRWQVKLGLRYGWYGYRIQEVDGAYRERSYLTLDSRVEYRPGKHWMLFVGGESEWNKSNDPLDEYDSWMVQGGLGAAW